MPWGAVGIIMGFEPVWVLGRVQWGTGRGNDFCTPAKPVPPGWVSGFSRG